MITKPLEYWRLLYAIQDENNFTDVPKNFIIPEDEPIYSIDLNSRLVKGPKFLSVQRDHKAECIYFRCARYLDHKDLTNTACIIQYSDPVGDPHIYVVPFYYVDDENTEEIIIPWQLDYEVTALAGTIEYAFRFYQVNGNDMKFDYCANTMPTTGEIKYGIDTVRDVDLNYSPTQLEALISKINEFLDNSELYWLEVK